MAENNGTAERYFTPTQRRMLAILGDGNAHPETQLMKCLNDDLTGIATLRVHITKLREKLRANCETVVIYSNDGVNYYQIHRMIAK
jgi:DNA-binding CsgD family transcriptional regulator